MKKLTFAVVVLSIIGFFTVINRDGLYEYYLQSQVHKNLTVESGNISYCGNAIGEKETPQQLIERTKNEFNGPDTFRKIEYFYDIILAQSEEYTLIQDKIKKWGWKDDQSLAEDIAEYEQAPYKSMAEIQKMLVEYKAQQQHRLSLTYTKKELDQQSRALTDELFTANSDKLKSEVTTLITQAACEINDESFIDEAKIIELTFDVNPSKDELEMVKSIINERQQSNLTKIESPLTAFTDKFAMLDKAFAEITVLNSETKIEDDVWVIHTKTVVTKNAFGKKTRFTIGCEAMPVGINSIFATSRISSCFVKKSDSKKSIEIYFGRDQIFTEEFDNEQRWQIVKTKLFEKI
jgi:hypothetical protein